MDWYRGMIHLAECQLNEELDDDPSAPGIRLAQYIDLRSESMRTIAKHIVDWPPLSLQ